MSDELIFVDEESDDADSCLVRKPWKILVVDDDDDIHQVTKLVLNKFKVDNHPVELLHAYNSDDAVRILESNGDIAVILLDVVMESEHAGLDLVVKIRQEMRNHYTRIVLRTGQPGQAPEASVIEEYDINDYKEKTELTTQKFKTLCISLIRSYRDICIIDQQRRALERLIESLSQIVQIADLSSFASIVLDQVVNLLMLDQDAFYCRIHEVSDTWAASSQKNRFEVLAASGEHLRLIENGIPSDGIPHNVINAFEEAIHSKKPVVKPGYYVGYYRTKSGSENLLYVSFNGSSLSATDQKLLNIYSSHVAICFENLLNQTDTDSANQKMLNIISHLFDQNQIKEESSSEVLCALAIAENANLPADEINHLQQLLPFYKIGQLMSPASKADIQNPSSMGQKVKQELEAFSESSSHTLQLAAKVCWQINENWDGSGQPEGLARDEIMDLTQIVGLADTFDRIMKARTLDSSWDMSRVSEYLTKLKGVRFNPVIVDALLTDLEKCFGYYHE